MNYKKYLAVPLFMVSLSASVGLYSAQEVPAFGGVNEIGVVLHRARKHPTTPLERRGLAQWQEVLRADDVLMARLLFRFYIGLKDALLEAAGAGAERIVAEILEYDLGPGKEAIVAQALQGARRAGHEGVIRRLMEYPRPQRTRLLHEGEFEAAPYIPRDVARTISEFEY